MCHLWILLYNPQMKTSGYNSLQVGLSIEIHQISWNLHEIHPKPCKSRCSTKTIQFDECRRGAMTLDFMKSGVIAPSMHPPNWRVFVETSDLIRLWVDFMWKSTGFQVKSTGFHEIHRISKLWAFVWWSSIGLSFFERPNIKKQGYSQNNLFTWLFWFWNKGGKTRKCQSLRRTVISSFSTA